MSINMSFLTLFIFCSFQLGLLGCAPPYPPRGDIVTSYEVIEPGVTLYKMAPVKKLGSDLNKNEPLIRNRNLIFAAYETAFNKAMEPFIESVYSSKAKPRLEEIAWWWVAKKLRGIYDEVLVVSPDKMTVEGLLDAISIMEANNRPYDLFLMTHGSPIPNHLPMNGEFLSYKDIDNLEGTLKHLNLVYMQGCGSETLASDWVKAGAQDVIAFSKVSFDHTNFLYLDKFIDFYRFKKLDVPKTVEATNKVRVSHAIRWTKALLKLHKKFVEKEGVDILQDIELEPDDILPILEITYQEYLDNLTPALHFKKGDFKSGE